MLKLQALLRPNFVSTFPLKCSLSKSGENEIELTKGVLRGIISELKEDMPRALSVCKSPGGAFLEGGLF